MRSDLGAIENRLAYTVSNLIDIAEKTADARSRLDDADFALESARLAKAGNSASGYLNAISGQSDDSVSS